MDEQTVLVVAGEDVTDRLGRALDGGEAVTLRSVTTVDDLFDALCYGTVSVLVVHGPVEGASPRDVLRGVRGFYPELPVVVFDSDDAGAGARVDDEDDDAGPVTFLAADALTDERVVEAVTEALATDDVGAAGRPPSRLETLAMSMFGEFPDQLYAKNASARHLLTSDAGLQTSDLIGRTDAAIDRASEEHTDRTVEDDRYVIEKGKPLIEREEYTGADGDAETRYTRTSKMPWYGPDGSVVGLVGVSRDISDWKSQERTLRQQNERLAKIAIVAAHELRNELQVATGRFDLATEDPDQAEVVADSLTQLETITNDVVRLANAETGEANRRAVWLSTSAREVWEALPTAEARLEVTEDRLVVADPRALRLFFEILLSNAVEHGGEDVTVTLAGTEDGFYVADDGAGIDLDPPERVFHVGFELEGKDVGIGLYVARRIAADHGWSLGASNRPEGGARFDVSGVTGPRDA
jgi:two-component system aerobic respiration control sensor histidine kinase ArcB